MRRRPLYKLVAQLSEGDFPNEPEALRKARVAHLAILRDYIEFLDTFDEAEWIAKLVHQHLAELHKDKDQYFRTRRREIIEAFRRALRSISHTREWWTTWRPFVWAGRAYFACFAIWLLVNFAPMTNGAGKSLEARCIRRFLTLLPQASP